MVPCRSRLVLLLLFRLVLLQSFLGQGRVVAEVVVAIEQPRGQRVLSFSEIQLRRDGQVLPDYLSVLSFSLPTAYHEAAHFCGDSNEQTYCQNRLRFNESSFRWEGEEQRPSLFVTLTDAYFDELIIVPRPGFEHHVVGAEITLYDVDRPPRRFTDVFQVASTNYTIGFGAVFADPPRTAVRLVDTVLYNGDLVAPVRVEYLYDVVDEFILVESWYTFSGKLKPHLYFYEPENYARFMPFMDKIKYVVIKHFPPTPPEYAGPGFSISDISRESWWREGFSRSFFKYFIRPLANDGEMHAPEVYIIADCDEIPDKASLWGLHNIALGNFSHLDSPNHFQMLMFYYNFHWLTDKFWRAPYIISYTGLLKLPDVSLPRYLGGKTRFGGGWHGSYFMSIGDIQRKIDSFSHQEFNTAAITNFDHIKECLRNGSDIFHRDSFVPMQRIEDASLQHHLPPVLYRFHKVLLELQELEDTS